MLPLGHVLLDNGCTDAIRAVDEDRFQDAGRGC